MTTYNKSSLALFFETGDIPTGTDFSNFIDSYVNVAETSAQTILSPLIATEFIAPRVSATNGRFTGTLGIGGVFSADAGIITTTLSASSLIRAASFIKGFGLQSTSYLSVTTDVSALGSIYASAGFYGATGVVSAAGTAQATAAPLAYAVNRGKGVVDGTTTGYALLANRAGLTQYLYNEGASANLWPPSGGIINGLAANSPLSLAASAMVTIVHLAASAYAVK